MFARVITAQAEVDSLDKVVTLAEQQLSGAKELPGFQGFYLLTDEKTGNVITISLWATREDMEAVAKGTTSGVNKQGAEAAGLSALELATYSVPVRAI